MASSKKTIGMIGCGALGRAIRFYLRSAIPSLEIDAILLRRNSAAESCGAERFRSLDEFAAWRPSLVVECAGHEAVRHAVPNLLRNGSDVIVLSVGSFCDENTFAEAQSAAVQGGSRLIVATGAVGGIDALRSARVAGLANVSYIGRKPPLAWRDTPADQYDLSSLKEPLTIFEGDAATAARLYPKNANVTAAVALAGIGFSRTRVTLIADPSLARNIHHIEAAGAFGSMRIEIENDPLPDNPRSSMLAALNAAYLVRRELGKEDF